jgi:hypothetical protein
MDIKKRVLTPKPKGRSINACLHALGADKEEVYSLEGSRHRKTIYERYGDGELLNWANELRKQALSECHPDRHTENKEHYEEVSKEVNETFDRVKHILKHRG